jgi:hypothetical protein
MATSIIPFKTFEFTNQDHKAILRLLPVDGDKPLSKANLQQTKTYFNNHPNLFEIIKQLFANVYITQDGVAKLQQNGVPLLPTDFGFLSAEGGEDHWRTAYQTLQKTNDALKLENQQLKKQLLQFQAAQDQQLTSKFLKFQEAPVQASPHAPRISIQAPVRKSVASVDWLKQMETNMNSEWEKKSGKVQNFGKDLKFEWNKPESVDGVHGVDEVMSGILEDSDTDSDPEEWKWNQPGGPAKAKQYEQAPSAQPKQRPLLPMSPKAPAKPVQPSMPLKAAPAKPAPIQILLPTQPQLVPVPVYPVLSPPTSPKILQVEEKQPEAKQVEGKQSVPLEPVDEKRCAAVAASTGKQCARQHVQGSRFCSGHQPQQKQIVCGDSGGRTQAGKPCQKAVKAGQRCKQHPF